MQFSQSHLAFRALGAKSRGPGSKARQGHRFVLFTRTIHTHTHTYTPFAPDAPPLRRKSQIRAWPALSRSGHLPLDRVGREGLGVSLDGCDALASYGPLTGGRGARWRGGAEGDGRSYRGGCVPGWCAGGKDALWEVLGGAGIRGGGVSECNVAVRLHLEADWS